ncbi:MAG: CAP domain-containing protein [Treponema sp.]|nr:CAP domain-containing protein [Treponema sp.]
MKRRFLFLLLTAFVASAMLFSFSSCSKGDDDDEDDIDWSKVTVYGYGEDEVTNCFNAINSFRTSDTWQWNETSTVQVPVTGRSAFVLNQDLCRVAELRAKELLKKFSHTRPNGQDCFSAYSDAGVSLSARGECIAAGYSTGASVTTGWREDNERYAGQGHRRILLASNATKVGIAYVYYPDSKYHYYWALVTAQ